MRPTKLPWPKNLCTVMALVWRCEARLSFELTRKGRRPFLRRMSFSRQMVDALVCASDTSFGFTFASAQAKAWAGTARPAAAAAAATAIRIRFRRAVRVMTRLRVEVIRFLTSIGPSDPGLNFCAPPHTFVQRRAGEVQTGGA